MDGGDRRQSQYGTPYPTSQPGRPAPGQPMGPPTQETYPQAGPSPSRSSLSGQSTARPYVPEYGYPYQQPQFPSQMQYPTSYIQDAPRQQHIQQPPNQSQYTTYGHGSMLPPTAQQSMYESMPQYQQQRHSTAIEVMPNQFGSFLPHSEQSGQVGVGQGPPSFLPAQSDSQSYASLPFGNRPQLQPPFTPGPSEYLSLEHSVSQQSQEDSTTRQAVEEGRRQYEEQIRNTFDAIIAGRVTDASRTLLVATEWLIGSIKALGLHHDDEDEHPQRVALWRELNHAWEALGQKQRSITETALRIQQQPTDYLTSKNIQDVVDKLIQFCDVIEKHGLVDYEMGIWEEQIVDVFIQCLDLLSQEQTGPTFVSQTR